MKFIVHWSQTHATFRAGIERFKETGALPPEGVTLLGRWFGMNGQGFAVVEASDAKALFAYAAEWSEFLTIEVTPAVEDAEAGEVINALF